MTKTSDIHKILDQQRQTYLQEQYDTLVLATAGIVPSSTTRITFNIRPTLVRIGYDGGNRAVLSNVTVETWRAGMALDEDDADGYISVRGHGHRAKKNGDPDPRARYEEFRLTPELAAPLLLAAMTRSPVAAKQLTQEGDAS